MTELPKVCLTIAGLDPSGGAGIIADIKTFSAFGCFATAAVASLTFQSTTGVFGAVHQSGETIRGQVQPILNDYFVSAVKTGMLPTLDVIIETAKLIKENSLKNVVVDPVIRSTSGFDLIDDDALRALIANLFPIADLVTPNIPEAERIAEMKIVSEADIHSAAGKMRGLGAANVLIKGGHFMESTSAPRIAKDFLFVGDSLTIFEAEYIETTSTHGTGCALAAAITANLALGKDLIESVGIAKDFVTKAIATAPKLGKGSSPINISN